MLLCGSAIYTFGRQFIGKFHVSARIAFPTLPMARNMFLENIYIPRRLKLELFKFIAHSATIQTFRRRHHAVIDMTAFLTFPSCKSFHIKNNAIG